MLHVFVGTDPWQRQTFAERALEQSIREFCPCTTEITWMRRGDASFDKWAGAAKWATPFSCFRWAVPGLCRAMSSPPEFAIYLDADMLVLEDLQELADVADGHELARCSMRFDVMCWNIRRLRRSWPSFGKAERSGFSMGEWKNMARRLDNVVLEEDWNSWDKLRPTTKLLHFTRLPTQPYHPYPHKYKYMEHPDRGAVELWEDYAQAKCQPGQLPPEAI